jgi:hypothetical protein
VAWCACQAEFPIGQQFVSQGRASSVLAAWQASKALKVPGGPVQYSPQWAVRCAKRQCLLEYGLQYYITCTAWQRDTRFAAECNTWQQYTTLGSSIQGAPYYKVRHTTLSVLPGSMHMQELMCIRSPCFLLDNSRA